MNGKRYICIECRSPVSLKVIFKYGMTMKKSWQCYNKDCKNNMEEDFTDNYRPHWVKTKKELRDLKIASVLYG